MRWLLGLPFFLSMLLSVASSLHAEETSLVLTEEEQRWIQQHPVIKVGNELDWPPFDYSVNGKALGYSIDLIQILASRLGLEIEFVNGLAWKDLQQQTYEGKIDVLPAIYKSEEREAYLAFTPDYYANPSVIVVNAANTDIKRVSDLSGKQVASVKGFWITSVLKKDFPQISVQEFDTVVECLKAVSLGKVDAYIDSIGLVSFTLENNFIPNLKVLGDLEKEKFSNPPLHMAVPRNQKILADMLSKAMKDLNRLEKSQLNKKWLEFTRYEKQIVFTEEQIKWINQHPVVEVGLDSDYAPYSFRNDKGEYIGIAPDFLKLLSEKIGIKFVIREGLQWSDIIELGKEHRIDMITPIVPTEERKIFFNFSPVYIPAPLVTIVNMDGLTINHSRSLDGLKVALVKNYSSSERVIKDNPNIEAIWVDTSLDALQLVATGQVDAFVSVLGVVTHLMRVHGFENLKLAGYYDEDYPGQRIAIRSDWPELSVLISEALDDISDAEKKAIYDRWITVPTEAGFDFVFFFQMLAIFLAIFILMAFYNHKLATEIRFRKKAEANLQQLNLSLVESRKIAENANKAKTEFISSMSHELRTPLTAIIGFTEILKSEDDIDERNREKIIRIQQAGQYVLKLIDDLLDLSIIETGNLRLNLETADIAAIMKECVDLVRPEAERCGLDLSMEGSSLSLKALVDVLRLKQVLLNILSNAIKYNSDAGLIKVSCEQHDGCVQISVSDTGKGIKESQLHQLFDNYERVGAEKTTIMGRGMGLAISKKLMEAMSGEIIVHSQENRGSIFILRMPLADGAQ